MRDRISLLRGQQKLFRNGFTIVELLVVITIIGILVAISIVSYTGITQKAIVVSLQSDLSNASQQLKMFQVEKDTYPTAINCTNPTSDEICLKSSPGVFYQYAANNMVNPQTFVLEAASSGQIYSVNQETSSSEGGLNLLEGDTSIERSSSREFLQYADLAPIFDGYGIRQYTISFDIKSADTSVRSTINVYQQNGSGSRYSFSATIPVTISYVRQSVTVIPVFVEPNTILSKLAFYGTYNTGNKPTVKNVKVELGDIATPWTQAP